MQLVTFVHVLFTPPLLLILVFQLILFHTIVALGHYMLCSIEKFVLKKIRAELLTVMSKVTHLLVCIVLTLCFVLLVQLALVHLKN